MRGARFKGDVRGKFFLQRVVGGWNSLPGEVVEADTIVSFKGHLDKYMNRMGIGRYGLGRVGGFSSDGQHGWCRLGGPKGLFLCCNFLCSLLFDSKIIFETNSGFGISGIIKVFNKAKQGKQNYLNWLVIL